MNRFPATVGVALVAAAGWSYPGRVVAQTVPEPEATWTLAGLRTGFCIDFLMDSAAAAKQVRKVDKRHRAVQAAYYSRLHPAVSGLVQRRPEFGTWTPASVCIVTADTVSVGGRIVTDDDPEERQMVGFWGIAARPVEELLADTVMVARVIFTSNHRIARNTSLEGLRIETVKEDRGDLPDVPGDRYYQIRVKKADIKWMGHMAGTPEAAEPRRWSLMFKGKRNTSWVMNMKLEPREQQFLVGSLRINGKDDLAKALKASPIRMQGPAFWSGSGTVEFFRR